MLLPALFYVVERSHIIKFEVTLFYLEGFSQSHTSIHRFIPF